MATKNVTEDATEVSKTDEVIYFKANRLLTTEEHKTLHEKIEYEMKKSGLKIVLVPFLVDMGDKK